LPGNKIPRVFIAKAAVTAVGSRWAQGTIPLPPTTGFRDTTTNLKHFRTQNWFPFVYLGEINAQTCWKELDLTTFKSNVFPFALSKAPRVCVGEEKTNCNFDNK